MSNRHSSAATAAGTWRWLIVVTLSLGLLGLASSTWADAMRCGSDLITDNKKPGASMMEVVQKCGEPYDKYGKQWLYVKGGSVYRVYFNPQGNVRRIQTEIVR